jgi:hypothetical protein
LDCRLVCKTCAFHDALQAGKQKEVHRTPLIWRLRANKVNLLVSSVLFVFWFHSPNFLDTPRMYLTVLLGMPYVKDKLLSSAAEDTHFV